MEDNRFAETNFYLGCYTSLILRLDSARAPGERWRARREDMYEIIRDMASNGHKPSEQPEPNLDEFGDDVDKWIDWMQEHNEGASGRISLPDRTDKSNTQ